MRFSAQRNPGASIVTPKLRQPIAGPTHGLHARLLLQAAPPVMHLRNTNPYVESSFSDWQKSHRWVGTLGPLLWVHGVLLLFTHSVQCSVCCVVFRAERCIVWCCSPGQGRAGQGRAGQGRAGQGVVWCYSPLQCSVDRVRP